MSPAPQNVKAFVDNLPESVECQGLVVRKRQLPMTTAIIMIEATSVSGWETTSTTGKANPPRATHSSSAGRQYRRRIRTSHRVARRGSRDFLNPNHGQVTISENLISYLYTFGMRELYFTCYHVSITPVILSNFTTVWSLGRKMLQVTTPSRDFLSVIWNTLFGCRGRNRLCRDEL